MTSADPTRLVARLSEGGSLTADEFGELVDGRDLIVLGMLADAVRKRRHGTRTTFVRVMEVPFDSEAPPAEAGPAGGLWRLTGVPPSTETLTPLVARMAQRAGATAVSGFSLEALASLCRKEGRSLTDLLSTLRDAGLGQIAEGAIDAGIDPVGSYAAARRAGMAVERATVTHLVSDWPATAERLAQVAEAYGSMVRFAPLPRGPGAEAATGYDDVRQVALARLVAPSQPSIQVDWVLHGPKLAQVALLFGADDIDVVVEADDATLGPRRGQMVDVRRSIAAAQLQAVERDGRREFMTA